MPPLSISRPTSASVPERPRRALDLLLTDLHDEDPQVRRSAVFDLADQPLATTALAERVGCEPDRGVREAICARLARHDLPAVVDLVVPFLHSDDAALRNDVVELLAALPLGTTRHMPSLLADEDADIRLLAVMVLCDLRSPQVESWLTDLVRHDPNAKVVAAALGELAGLAGERHWDDLVDAERRFPDDPFIRFLVREATHARDGDRP